MSHEYSNPIVKGPFSGDVSGYVPYKPDAVTEQNDKAAKIAAHVDEGGGAVKFDTDKTRLELFPGDALFAIGDILTSGAKKYADRNWEKGMKWSRPFGAAMRHGWAWWQGKVPTKTNFLFGDLDMETGRSHLWHWGCCVVFLIAYEMRGVGADDRPQ